MEPRWLFGAALAVALATFVAADAEVEARKDEGKAFSLFSVVSFANKDCRSSDDLTGGARNGTCYTSTECSDKSGTKSGNCAAGFGVCCVFIISDTSGGTVSENCTYLRNPGYPSAYTATSSLTYKINKCSDNVCQVRLDFESFQTVGLPNTLETTGGVCDDKLTLTASAGGNLPVICGANTGQHVYLELGKESSSTAQLAFTFSTAASTTRKFEIKVTQYLCNQAERAPEGCLQYHTTAKGRFETFNFPATTNPGHLASHNYAICIKQLPGMCCNEYQVCPDITAADGATVAFSLEPTKSDDAEATDAEVDKQCSNDYIGIPGSNGECVGGGHKGNLHTKYCGRHFIGFLAATIDTNGPVCDCTPPFEARIYTDALTDDADGTTANTVPSVGVCMEYQQLPC